MTCLIQMACVSRYWKMVNYAWNMLYIELPYWQEMKAYRGRRIFTSFHLFLLNTRTTFWKYHCKISTYIFICSSYANFKKKISLLITLQKCIYPQNSNEFNCRATFHYHYLKLSSFFCLQYFNEWWIVKKIFKEVI